MMPTANTERSDTLGLAPMNAFRPDVQALRGLAVLAVVLWHAQVLLPGGFVGVDIFFVISGFVIGRLLVSEFESTGRMSFKSFYVRRARRLLPALGLMLATVILLAPLFAPSSALSVISLTGIATALFGANALLYEATGEGYFDAAAELNPLLHTWSLSVEEQFYFVIPALMFLAWRLGRGRAQALATLRIFVAGLFAVSLGLCLLFSYVDSIGPLNGLRFAFFSPLTRAWEFAAGLALVLLPNRWCAIARLRSITVGGGLAIVGLSMLMYSDATRFPGAAALLPVIGTALVIYGRTAPEEGHPSNQRLLRPMIWLGDLSYSWYLWHWPLIVFAGAFWPNAGPFPRAAAAVVSLLPAWLSNQTLEQRLRATPRTRPRQTLILALCCVAAPLGAAVIAQPVTALISGQREVASFADATERHLAFACGDGMPIGQRETGDCSWGSSPTNSVSVLLIGDSNADHFSEAFIGAAESGAFSLRIAWYGGCPFADVDIVDGGGDSPNQACTDFVGASIEYLVTRPPDIVVIANATDVYLSQERITLVDPIAGTIADGGEKEPVFEAGLERVITYLRTAGIRVVIINTTPKPGGAPGEWDPRRCSNFAVMVDSLRCAPPMFLMSQRDSLRIASALEDRVSRDGGAELWNFNTVICPADQCAPIRNGTLVWRDGTHISVATSEALTPAVTDYLDLGVSGD